MSNTTNVRQQDPRNVGDKTVITESVRKLATYLMQHNFDSQIQPKHLMKPTTKVFTDVTLFLFRQMDPNYTCTGKFEDEMITMFKYLGYPFQISKTNIAAVGAPHSWPAMLGCLMWLVELLLYMEGAAIGESAFEESYEQGEALDPCSEKGFYSYLAKSYTAFIHAKDDVYAQLTDKFVAGFEHNNEKVRDDTEYLERKNAALAAEIDEVKQRSAYLPQLEAKRREMHNGLAKLQGLIQQMSKDLDVLRAKVSNRKVELEKLNVSNSAINADIATLRVRISGQELSPEDVHNMLNEKQRLEDAHAQASSQRQSLQSRIWELELSLREKVAGLEETVRSYHSIAEDLKMVPSTAVNARGENLQIEIDTRTKKREGLLKTEIRKAILPVLQSVHTELNSTTLSLRNEMLAEEDAAEEVQLLQAQRRDEIDSHEARVRRVEAQYKREKEGIVSVCAAQLFYIIMYARHHYRVGKDRGNASQRRGLVRVASAAAA